jgi:hypothetical protein
MATFQVELQRHPQDTTIGRDRSARPEADAPGVDSIPPCAATAVA